MQCDKILWSTIFDHEAVMALNNNNLSSLEIFSSSSATVFVVTYANGSTEAFQVPTQGIVFRSTQTAAQFCAAVAGAAGGGDDGDDGDDDDDD